MLKHLYGKAMEELQGAKEYLHFMGDVDDKTLKDHLHAMAEDEIGHAEVMFNHVEKYLKEKMGTEESKDALCEELYTLLIRSLKESIAEEKEKL